MPSSVTGFDTFRVANVKGRRYDDAQKRWLTKELAVLVGIDESGMKELLKAFKEIEKTREKARASKKN